jgi:dihydroorotate dehydrogenase (NAD+) catalytic subunit
VTLATTVAGLHFPNPVLLASGTAGYGVELHGVMALARLGGLVTKAVSRLPRSGNAPPRVAEFRGGMLNSVGLANPGVEEVRNSQLPALAALRLPGRVLVNVVGFTVEEYAEVIGRLDDLDGHDGYELNLSCPNTSAGGMEFGADPRAVEDVVRRCRAVTSRPLFAKLSPVLPDIAMVAAAAVQAGADGLTLINTMPGMLFHGSAPRLGNGFGGVSGPALLATGVLAVQRVKARMPDTAVIGVGGIRGADDARQYFQAGANLVAIGTGAMADPRLPGRIITELERGNG